MARSITFRGKEAVIKAYDMNGIGPWAVACQNKILCTSSGVGELDTEAGCAQLEEFMDMMMEHGSQAQYELKVYRLKETEEDIYITEKTPASRSIPFSLFENEHPGKSNGDNRLLDLLTKMELRMNAMEAKLLDRELEDEDEPEDNTVMGKIGSLAVGFLERPDVQQAIAVGAMNLVKKFGPNMGSVAQAEGRKVAGVEPQYVNLLTPDQIEKVHAAVTRLSAKDAKLGDHLTQLATIAETSPAKYAVALTLL
jgi:hypothetical protein